MSEAASCPLHFGDGAARKSMDKELSVPIQRRPCEEITFPHNPEPQPMLRMNAGA